MEIDEETLVVLFILGVFSITGSVGNSLVLYIYSKKKDKSTSSIFILSLAATDFLTCLIIIPYTIATLYLKYKLVYDAVCHVYMFLLTCNVPFAAFTMVTIAFDRYFCICHPFLHVITILRAKIIVCILAVFSVCLGCITSSMYSIKRGDSSMSDLINSTNFNLSTDVSSYTTINSVNFTSQYVNVSDKTGSDNFTPTIDLHIGECAPDENRYDYSFVVSYAKFQFALYILAFLIVVVLYALIYKEIHVRRAKKAKRKRSSLFPSSPVEISMAETQLTALNGNHNDTTENNVNNKRKKSRKIGTALKEKQFYANIRTAAMLFMVTVVFVFAFFPSWLMAHTYLPYNIIVFYMYFMYNVANPVIYSFMNKSFRTELKAILSKMCT